MNRKVNIKPSLALRIAAVTTLLFAIGHTVGGMQSWSPPGRTEVLDAMKSFHFDADGVSRSYLDFYLGFGFIISVYLFLQALLLWQSYQPLRAGDAGACRSGAAADGGSLRRCSVPE
jgi:hypothetical protein